MPATVCRRLESDTEFAALEAAWDRLLERHPSPHAFITFDWLRTWWECFTEGSLALFEVRDGGELIGLFPLHRRVDRTPLGSFRILRSLTNTHTPRYDFIVEKQRIDEVVDLWLRTLTTGRDWDALELDYVPADSPVMAALEQGCTRLGLAFRRIPHGVSPYVPIEGDWETYYEKRSKALRDNLRYAEKKLAQIGPCVVERTSESPTLEERLETAFEIESESWKGREGTAILSSESAAQFYRKLAGRCARHDRFALYFLWVGQRAVAFDYCIRHEKTLNLVKIGYRSDDLAKFSPGSVLRKRVLESLFQTREAETYEMLGIQADWKMKWTQETRRIDRIFIYHRGLRGRGRFWIQFGLPELAKRIPFVNALRKPRPVEQA